MTRDRYTAHLTDREVWQAEQIAQHERDRSERLPRRSTYVITVAAGTLHDELQAQSDGHATHYPELTIPTP